MEALKESLEERLVEHDNRREEVQDKIKEREAPERWEMSICWRKESAGTSAGPSAKRKRRSPPSLTSSETGSGQETRK